MPSRSRRSPRSPPSCGSTTIPSSPCSPRSATSWAAGSPPQGLRGYERRHPGHRLGLPHRHPVAPAPPQRQLRVLRARLSEERRLAAASCSSARPESRSSSSPCRPVQGTTSKGRAAQRPHSRSIPNRQLHMRATSPSSLPLLVSLAVPSSMSPAYPLPTYVHPGCVSATPSRTARRIAGERSTRGAAAFGYEAAPRADEAHCSASRMGTSWRRWSRDPLCGFARS
jgi:hypothetical protein